MLEQMFFPNNCRPVRYQAVGEVYLSCTLSFSPNGERLTALSVHTHETERTVHNLHLLYSKLVRPSVASP